MKSTLGVFAFLVVLGGAVLTHSGEWTAPPEEKARANPVTPDPEALLKGRGLYQRHCASCHGEILWKITHGRREADEILMPAFGKKIRDEEDRWKVVLFVRALAMAPEAEPR